MDTHYSSEDGQPVPEAIVHQPILQQGEAVVAAQTNPARPTRQDALLQQADFLAHYAAEDDDVPPPAYGDTYGEIRNEKDGLGTSARVTDDGRVNIRINQFNQRLSQLLTPALRQQVESIQDSRPPPPPYIPPSLGGEERVPPPPPLNVVIQVVGSRGDVQPFVALGKVLKDTYGHRVRLATHPTFKGFVQENGLEFFSIGGDPSKLMAFMVKNPGLMPGFRSLLSGDVRQRRRDVAEYIQGCWRSCYQAGDGIDLVATDDDLSGSGARPFVADCIIANPPSFAHIHCAEKLGIPLHIMFTMPYSPTQAFPHPLANIQSSNADPQLTNYISYVMIELLSWQGLGEIINRFRARCLGLDPVSLIWAPGMLQRLKVPHTYCWSPALIPKPKDWGPHIAVSGFCFLNLASNYTPTPDLETFLDAGPPPVYVGFGSIVLENPNAMTELIFEAMRKTGQRVLLSKGWGGIGASELRIPDGVFMLGNVPHDWLFEHVSCVVHHGGAGTTAAGITAGRPTVVVPFFGDQPFWGAMVARAGAGPDPIPYEKLTADRLADAISFCLRPESLERAKELAGKVGAERGSDMGAQSFHQYLEADRLRCTLAPHRAAAWRIRRTQVRLSAFAACTLANANLLDSRDLKLYRPREYETDEGPLDPISGGFVAACGAFSSMAMGLADIPSETWKALQLPFRPSRQQSQASVPTMPGNREISNARERSTPPPSPEQSQTSLSVQESLGRIRSPSKPSSLSSTTLNIGSSSMFHELEGRRSECGAGKHHDMLRPTGVHTSKGLGRFAKALVQSPMEVSMSVTRGLQNLPKLWGDDTVRRQAQVNDFTSGAKAAGKEFGLGWYDGVTGLVTHPWKGAQKDGASGFLKGIGKGMGGFLTKPSAAAVGVTGYLMKGVHKEVQKLFGSNVQNYIYASRAAQGYEEWLQSSDTEKEEIIVQWKLIQKYMKKKHNSDEMVQDMLEAQRKMNMENRETRQDRGNSARSAQSGSVDTPSLDSENVVLPMGSPPSSEEPLRAAEVNQTIQLSVQETSHRNAGEDFYMEWAIQENMSRLQSQQQEAADHQADRENLRQAMTASEAEAQRHASEALEHERLLKRVVAQSRREQRRRNCDSESEPYMCLDDDDDDLELAPRQSERMAEKAVAVTIRPPGVQQPLSYDPGHLTGTTQIEFEAQQQGQQREKTTQEKTEEIIVMEYVRKQSLLELHHQNKGKSRATATEDEADEDLQKALKLSMQGHECDADYRYGEASGT
ncbi:Fc.00g046220.m01.CDS01 [Cosmosporella sp. VM-42]